MQGVGWLMEGDVAEKGMQRVTAGGIWPPCGGLNRPPAGQQKFDDLA